MTQSDHNDNGSFIESVTSGLRYGPTSSNKRYISLYIHRGNGDGRHKNKWKVPPPEEYQIFHKADSTTSKCDQTGDYWGFKDSKGSTIGEQGERLAKFPETSNLSDDWHGYPVKKDSKRPNCNLPNDDIVKRWLTEGLIETHFGLKILRGAV